VSFLAGAGPDGLLAPGRHARTPASGAHDGPKPRHPGPALPQAAIAPSSYCATNKHLSCMRVWDGPLATAIAQGDLGAVGAAFDRHGQELYDYCQSQLGNVADAAEVVQATFVIAAAKASLLQNTARLRAWLFAIARSGCQQRLRAGAKPAYLDEIANSVWDRLGGTAWRSDLLSTAWTALAEMSPRDSEIAELSMRHGLDTAELADVLGLPRDQARTLAQSIGDRFEASWDLLLADCRGRSWYCETAAGYLTSLNGDLTRVTPRWMHEHAARCEVCAKRERLNPGSAVVLGLLPAATLAADERKRLLWLLSDSSADVKAYRAEVILRLGPFGPDGYPGRASSRAARPRAARPRRMYVAAAGAATLVVALVGAGAFLVDEHFDAQSGLQPGAGRQSPSPPSTQPPKTDASAAAPSPGKHSSSTRPSVEAPSTSASPQGGDSSASSPSPSPRPSSPRPRPSHSSSPPPSASPSPSQSPSPTTPSPTPTPSPDPTPTSSAALTRAHLHWPTSDRGHSRPSSPLRSGSQRAHGPRPMWSR
jgi:RNA polymerase sigma factor (sigma-70 family)